MILESVEEQIDLTRIYIRAQVGEGEWKNLSLAKLLEDGLGEEIEKWFIRRVLRAAQVELPLDGVGAKKMVRFLWTLGQTVYQFNPHVDESPS